MMGKNEPRTAVVVSGDGTPSTTCRRLVCTCSRRAWLACIGSSYVVLELLTQRSLSHRGAQRIRSRSIPGDTTDLDGHQPRACGTRDSRKKHGATSLSRTLRNHVFLRLPDSV